MNWEGTKEHEHIYGTKFGGHGDGRGKDSVDTVISSFQDTHEQWRRIHMQ